MEIICQILVNGDYDDVENYNPVSHTSFMAKSLNEYSKIE